MCVSCTTPGVAGAAGLGPLLETLYPGKLDICTLTVFLPV